MLKINQAIALHLMSMDKQEERRIIEAKLPAFLARKAIVRIPTGQRALPESSFELED